jgi:hypothetical protein
MGQNQIFSNFTIDFNLSYMRFCTFDHKIILVNVIYLFLMKITIFLIWPNFTLYIV